MLEPSSCAFKHVQPEAQQNVLPEAHTEARPTLK
eukprot:SAG11_NODE_33794_length_275_cov_0.869318_1_plen_33_part_10